LRLRWMYAYGEAMRNVFLWTMIACAIPALAQSNDPVPPHRLITLNVSATNSRDEPVTDLKLDDLQLREDGKPQPLVFFRFAGANSKTAPPTPGEFANHPTPPPVVILLDRWNERLVMSSRSGIELGTAIQRLETVGNVYIYFLTNKGELAPVHPMPGTGEDLHVEANPSPAELRAELDRGIQEYQGFRTRDDLSVRINTTFQALEALMAKIGGQAGRKSLIWVTEGIPLIVRTGPTGTVDFTSQVRGLSELAARSQIAIYSVDQTNGTGASELSRTLEMFSALTGGRWYGRDDAAHALADALIDARGAYRIGYYSAAPEKDGKEYKIRLDTPRKGVHLLARQGFTSGVAGPDPDQIETAAFNNQIDSPLDAADIRLRVALSRTQPAGTIHFDIHVDPADVLIEHIGELYNAKLDVMVAFYSGGLLKGTSPATRTVLGFTQAQLDPANKEGFLLPLNLPVGSDIQNARVIVFDPGSQALGSVTVPTK
jgi:VWFA-related protein